MDDTHASSSPPADDQGGTPDGSGGPAGAPPEIQLSPGAARRRFGVELRNLREKVNLTLAEAGKEAIQRSAATISRFESGQQKKLPRPVEVDALLDCYERRDPEHVTADVRSWILGLLELGGKSEWFEPFKNSAGDVLKGHIFKFVGYETDATQIWNYESDLVPGLLQTRDYARAVAKNYYPDSPPVEHDTFAEFRVARRVNLQQRSEHVRLYFFVNEVALRRTLGGSVVMREQLEFLAEQVRTGGPFIDLSIVPLRTVHPAALSGSFVVMSFPDGVEEFDELVYLESRSGAKYLSGDDEIERFTGYRESLLESRLPEADALALIDDVIADLPDQPT